MNVIILVGFLTFLSAQVSSNTVHIDETMKQKLVEIITECQKTTHASDADLQALKNKSMPKSHEGLCLVECMMEAMHFMMDGKFNKEGAFKTVTPAFKGDSKNMKKLSEIGDKCEKEIGAGDSDKCVTAKMLAECLEKNAKESGLKMSMHE